MAKKQQLTKEQQKELYKKDWIMRNCNQCEIVPFKHNKIGKCPYYKNEEKKEEFNELTKFLTCPVQIKLINELTQKNKMRECFWSIYKFRTYIQLGKNYTLYVVTKNKEGQWIEKKIINFLPLLKLSPFRCENCGRKLIRYDKWIEGYSVYLCPKCYNLEV